MSRRRHAFGSCVRPPWLALIVASPLVSAGTAAAIDGTYLGTYQETDLGADTESIRSLEHRTDLHGRRALAQGVDGGLRANLRYSSRPGEVNTELLRSRLFGDAVGSAWRVHGQWMPWQDRSPGVDAPRQRELNLGGQWSRAPGGTALALDWSRMDVETASGRSHTEDRRAELGRNWNGVRATASWRRLDSAPPVARLADPSETEEWRTAVGLDRNWRKVSFALDSDAVLSRYRSGARRRDFHAEYVQASTSWRAVPRVVVSALGQVRKGESDDNAFATPRPLDDRAVSLGAEYRPVDGLALEGSREHRRREDASADDVVTDYFRLGARFQRALTRISTFNTGYEHSIDLAGDDAEVPRNHLWAAVEAKVRPGITGRADVRTQNSPLAGIEGRTWRYGTQFVLKPTPDTRVDAQWAREKQTELAGVSQRENEWSLTGAWSVGPSDVVSSLRIRDGEGRIARSDRTWSMTSSLRFSRGSSVSLDASRRDAETAGRSSEETTWGFGLTTHLPRDVRVNGSLRRIERTGAPRSLAGTVTLDVDFNLGGAS
jgi:hypothetical protein